MSNQDSNEQSEGARLLESETIKTFMNTDGALEVLLARLKRSIGTGDEIAKYVKRKAQIEDDHYNQLKKYAGNVRGSLKNTKNKNDSFSNKLDQIIEFDERLYSVGSSYVKALNTMHDEIVSLVNTVSRTRKNIKDEAKRKEKECADSISMAEKAKQKYYHCCDDLERLKMSDPNKKSFLKSKPEEEELQRKVDLADQDYKTKVSACKKLKDEMLMIYRPTNTKKLKNLILEMDIALNVQLQKFATWSETLIMNSGVLISPLQADKQSMKAIAASIDNELDLYNYISKNSNNPTNKSLTPVEYTPHPSFAKHTKPAKPFFNNTNSSNNLNANNGNNAPSKSASSGNLAPTQSSQSQNQRNSSSNSNSGPEYSKTPATPAESTASTFTYSSLDPSNHQSDLTGPKSLSQVNQYAQPTFGVSIEEVIQYAGIDNVPLVVKRCIDVIESYGLDIEGIYRTSGNKTTVQHLKESIDSNFANYLLIGNNIDPNNVLDADIYCTASLMKIYFASLPEPLLTTACYQSFIETVKSTDETFIAKKLHHLVYNLPDGAYFTLRALIFHLNKVAAHQHNNRMTAKSLAIIWGPALLNDNSMSPQDLSHKTKVVEELMLIANEIFDADE
ncbi:uncharacterized protein CXQ87_000257 [Candidozyma duobushaemuli]|uniref:Uncharacterized protein n=2 Tax=Candidozyma TaxID=3303203 RepID=A0ABX8I2D8_9ASCO|nr:uncharacterized protein CXQ87_000257 [[Candida] duobushaemulonis]PVH17372.1 hypothetical protein CXQ87_000257 [[Candida] duobushaemulonis]QWU86015.1 hypothetical protein CA3LBN_000233 [[Candida] haemuloni]